MTVKITIVMYTDQAAVCHKMLDVARKEVDHMGHTDIIKYEVVKMSERDGSA